MLIKSLFVQTFANSKFDIFIEVEKVHYEKYETGRFTERRIQVADVQFKSLGPYIFNRENSSTLNCLNFEFFLSRPRLHEAVLQLICHLLLQLPISIKGVILNQSSLTSGSLLVALFSTKILHSASMHPSRMKI